MHDMTHWTCHKTLHRKTDFDVSTGVTSLHYIIYIRCIYMFMNVYQHSMIFYTFRVCTHQR